MAHGERAQLASNQGRELWSARGVYNHRGAPQKSRCWPKTSYFKSQTHKAERAQGKLVVRQALKEKEQ